jgi:hypothetical protein
MFRFKGELFCGNAKHQLLMALKRKTPAAAPTAKLATAAHMRRNRDRTALRSRLLESSWHIVFTSIGSHSASAGRVVTAHCR